MISSLVKLLDVYAHEFALMKSDPPIAQHQSPRRQTGQGSGGPRIRSETQPSASDPAGQSDSRKRKLALSDDEGMIPESSKIKERPEDLRSQLIRRRKPPVVLY